MPRVAYEDIVVAWSSVWQEPHAPELARDALEHAQAHAHVHVCVCVHATDKGVCACH